MTKLNSYKISSKYRHILPERKLGWLNLPHSPITTTSDCQTPECSNSRRSTWTLRFIDVRWHTV